MAADEVDGAGGVEPIGDEVLLMRSGGVLVLDGPREAIDRLTASDPALAAADAVPTSTGLAKIAPSALAAVLGNAESLAGGVGSGNTQRVFTLDPVGQAMFDSGSLASVGDGAFRLFGHGADGKFLGHGSIKEVAMAPQQLATAQIAVATMALTAAIKEVQEAVERVEDKVDLLRDILESARDGEVLGANRALRRRASNLGFDSVMADVDWHAVDDIGIEVEQQIEGLRSFIRKRLAAAESDGLRISGRLDAVQKVRDISETLALLIVAQDSLFLFQQMRVLRIKGTQPELADAAAKEARALLDEHDREDAELVARLRGLVADRVEVDPLEVLRYWTAAEINRLAPEVDDSLAWFAEQRGLGYDPVIVPPLPGAAEVVGEVRDRGAALASGGRRVIGGLADRVRTRGDADSAELESGEIATSLPTDADDTRSDDDPGDGVEEERTGFVSRVRSSTLGRVRRRGGGRDEVDLPDPGDDRSTEEA